MASLLAVDLLAILLARVIGAACWRMFNPGVGPDNYFDLHAAVLSSLAVYGAFGLYVPAGLSPVEELRRSVAGSALVALTLTAGAFLAKESVLYSRGVFLVSGIFVAVLVPLFRALVRSLFAACRWWGASVVILGAGRTARLLIETLHSNPELGLKPVACLDDDPAKEGELAGVAVAGPLRLTAELARAGVRHAIVAMPGVDRGKLVAILERHCWPFKQVIVIPDLFGLASLWVSPKDLGGILGLELRQNLLLPFNRALKWVLDFFVALGLGVLLLPALIAAALWIRLGSGSPVFYRQRRQGQHGREITVFKLRTMQVDADSLLANHLEDSADARREWERFFKLRHDPRVLPGIGWLLRRTSLDELPQLWNVLRGEMSLVGPRPLPDYHLDRFSSEFRALRNRVKPGVTGLWQISARSEGDLIVQEALDTFYIRNWSPWLDLYVLTRTFRAVVTGYGAY
jgi:Undecaprenyl-phosphate galactose phosphotransferase WbaP